MMIQSRGPGQPTKLTPERQQIICDLIATGNYIKTACLVAGIDETTYCGWQRAAKNDLDNGLDETSSIYVQFFKATKNAEAKSQARLVGLVSQAAVTNWIPAMTLLERRWPAEFGRRDKTTVDLDADTIKTLFRELGEARNARLKVIEGECKEITDGAQRPSEG